MAIPDIEYKYIDQIDVMETFCDHLQNMTFDGQTLRLEFAVSRLGEPTPSKTLKGKRYTVSRIVTTPQVALDLHNKLNILVQQLEKSGALKRIQPEPQQIQ